MEKSVKLNRSDFQGDSFWFISENKLYSIREESHLDNPREFDEGAAMGVVWSRRDRNNENTKADLLRELECVDEEKVCKDYIEHYCKAYEIDDYDELSIDERNDMLIWMADNAHIEGIAYTKHICSSVDPYEFAYIVETEAHIKELGTPDSERENLFEEQVGEWQAFLDNEGYVFLSYDTDKNGEVTWDGVYTVCYGDKAMNYVLQDFKDAEYLGFARDIESLTGRYIPTEEQKYAAEKIDELIALSAKEQEVEI